MSDGTQPLGIGETLRAARRRQGHTLADVADGTKARESYLAAIEQEEFEVLGGDVYARGFIASYAKFLGLDPAPLLESYGRTKEAKLGRQRPPRPEGGTGGPAVRVRQGRVAVLAAVIAALLIVVLLIAGVWGGGEDEALGAAPAVVAQT